MQRCGSELALSGPGSDLILYQREAGLEAFWISVGRPSFLRFLLSVCPSPGVDGTIRSRNSGE